MEFKARYELIGIFTLAVLAMAFGFVWWLNNVSGGGTRVNHYKVLFDRPVSGLMVGGGVFFNGLRVGEVRALSLDPGRPSLLQAEISVNADIALRQDTKVGVDYQGLTGIAAIALQGGSADAPVLDPATAAPLRVSTGAGNDWTRSANLVLSQFNDILSENRQHLKEIMDNLASFSKSLGGNKERVENILNGLERMTGGKGRKAGLVYDLLPPKDFIPPANKPSWRLVINDPTVLLALNTDKIQMRPSAGETLPLGTARWSDNLPNLVQAKLIQSFENAGYARSVLRPLEGEDSDNKLLLDIRGFYLSTGEKPGATVSFMAKLVNGEGRVLAAKLFESFVPVATDKEKPDEARVAKALGKAFAISVHELITWSAEQLST